MRAVSYPSDLTDDQWELLEPVFNALGKRGRKLADDLRTVADAMLYIAQTGCQWRYLPQSFGPPTTAAGTPILGRSGVPSGRSSS